MKEREARPGEESEAAPEAHVVSELEAVRSAIQRVFDDLEKEKLKPSTADLMRLADLRDELTGLQPRLVTVGWVGEWPQTPASGE